MKMVYQVVWRDERFEKHFEACDFDKLIEFIVDVTKHGVILSVERVL